LWEQSLPLLAKSSRWLFDLSNVTSANSAALSLLLEWTKYANQKGKEAKFSSMPEKLVMISKAGGLQHFFA
jgi:ABC-type transporter Mla MlaB component